MMKVLLFVLFAGYAVRCDDKNYYVIEMVEEPIQKPFKVYWNVPTKQCKSKKIPFRNLYEKYGIIQNENDAFMGEKVTILYDPGLFPALLKNETSGRFKFRNGGVPQEGDLTKHLEAFKDELDLSIPEENFSGIGVIDFESWRPTYRQNFGVLRPYQDVSFEIERNRHWWWQKNWLQAEAKRRFEEAAHTFMQTTIALAKQLRPRARWGFYGFPYCFNMASNNMVEACASNVPQENDNISWLWRESTALYPSVYSSVELTTRQMTSLIRGRVKEAARFGRQILPYFWYRYRDAGFLSEVDLEAALSTLYKSNASGFIIWGSSSDVNTVEKCNKLLNYIEQIMGPAIAKYTKSRRLQDDTDVINTTTDSTLAIEKDTTVSSNTVSNSNTYSTNGIKDLDPEYHWVPPENYTQTIKDHVEEEINKKLTNYTETENTVLDNNVLIDLILNSLINNVSNSQENATKSNEISSTIKIVNNDTASELLSSTTTEGAKDLEGEFSSSSRYTEIDGDKRETNLDAISTESTKSFEATTSYYDRYKETTEMTGSFFMHFMEYETTSISSDSFTNSLDDTSKSKNFKKTTFQDSLEGFLDLSTQPLLSTETTESSTSQIEVIDNTAVDTSKFTDHTTEHSHYFSEETSNTDITTLQTELIKAMSKSLRDEVNSKDITKPNETETLSTTESIHATKIHTSSLNLRENNETMQPSSNQSKSIDNLSTKAPDFKKHTDFKVTTEAQIEDTSLSTMTTSPEQVSGSAHRITKSQTLYCIVFYIYSVSKCLCFIFKQCS